MTKAVIPMARFSDCPFTANKILKRLVIDQCQILENARKKNLLSIRVIIFFTLLLNESFKLLIPVKSKKVKKIITFGTHKQSNSQNKVRDPFKTNMLMRINLINISAKVSLLKYAVSPILRNVLRIEWLTY